MGWFHRKEQNLKESKKKDIPSGLWEKCSSCNEILYKLELDKRHSVCHHCNHHFRVSPDVYLNLLFEEGQYTELFKDLKTTDPLNFKAGKKYKNQLKTAMEKTGHLDAIRCFDGMLIDRKIILGIMNFKFIGGSMGIVVGEKVVRATVYAEENKVPLIIICASGGARMQEGALSLMQMARTSAQLAQFSKSGGLYVSLLTDPTTGGVTASFGMLGDVILAEPGALIGFAGPRVIKQTIGEDLPAGFQRAEFLMDKGFVDRIVPRIELKNELYNLINVLT
jgi:acetyl-CoA carboxylase carboxyl transferase subunit beta